MKSQTQRSILYGFIASISATGLVGIYVLLLGNFGRTEARILGTTSAIAAASILALACAAAWEARRWTHVAQAGVSTTVLTLLLTLGLIWDALNGETPERLTISACIGAVAFTHACLLGFARLTRRHEIVRLLTVAAITALSLGLLFVIWGEPRGDEVVRILGVLSIVVVCGTIAIPILHRVAALRVGDLTVTTALELSLTCPRCHKTQSLPAGRSRCGECGLRFVIQIEEEHCPKCGYVLYRIQSPNCPECGTLLPTAKSDS